MSIRSAARALAREFLAALLICLSAPIAFGALLAAAEIVASVPDLRLF